MLCRQAWMLRVDCPPHFCPPLLSPILQLEVLRPRTFTVATEAYIMSSDTDVKPQQFARVTPRAREFFSLSHHYFRSGILTVREEEVGGGETHRMATLRPHTSSVGSPVLQVSTDKDVDRDL